MRTRLLKKVRRYAECLLENELTRFQTSNGRVTVISYTHRFEWAFMWLLGKRIDYDADREKIVHVIARIAWDKFLRDKWTRKLRKEPRNAD